MIKARFLDKQIVERYFEHFRQKVEEKIKKSEAMIPMIEQNHPYGMLLKIIATSHKNTYSDWLALFDMLEIGCLNIMDQRDMLCKEVEAQTFAEKELISKQAEVLSQQSKFRKEFNEQSEVINELKKHGKNLEWVDKYFNKMSKTTSE